MNRYWIPNLDKACLVIEMVAGSPDGCTMKEIGTELAIPRTTALRITQTLLERGFFDRNDEGAFTLGPAMVHLGVLALDRLDVRTFARPVLKNLTTDTGESAHIALLSRDKALLVEVCDPPRPIRIASRPGTLVDLHCSATGKVLLAYGIADSRTFCRRLELSAHTVNTRTSVEDVLRDIEQIRRQGYAVDDEEYLPGARCIAVPVMNTFGKTIAAIGITASTSTMPTSRIPQIRDRLKRAAREMSGSMGFSASTNG